MRTLTVDIDRLQQWIDELARFSEATPPAVTRVLFSDVDLAARAWVRQRFADEGLSIRQDAIGNIFARWDGGDGDTSRSADRTAGHSAGHSASHIGGHQATRLAAIATGSHIDAIPNAGRYDGVVGVLGAIEAVSVLRRAGFTPTRPIEIVMFTAEEPTRFGIGCLGSRMLSGALSPARAAALKDVDGHALDYWRARADLATTDLASVPLAAHHYAAFVELHIEQGPQLERLAQPIAIVESIAGPSSFRIRLTGEGGHAGAVLMADRHDAGLAGAEIALVVEQAAKLSESPDTVGTTGVFRQLPNAINSIPCDVTLDIDFRDTSLDTRTRAWARVEDAIDAICTRRGVTWTIDTLNEDPPATCAPALIETISRVCVDLDLPAHRLVSRAYHDALFMAQVCPSTMIFVPSRGGVSHRPDEYTSPEQIEKGVRVLAETLARLSEGV